jgi:hypothetical protein
LLLIFQARAQPLNALSAEEKAEGFELLFDGTLESFRANFQDYRKRDTSTTGTLGSGWRLDTLDQAIASTGGDPDIRSKIMYKDFDLRLQYRNDGNQGVFYRFLATQNHPWETGPEFAIEETVDYFPRERAGAAFDLFAPAPGTYRPFGTGAWNDLRIVARGDSIEHWLNGIRVLGYRLHSPAFWQAYDRSKWAGFKSFTLRVPGDRDGGYIARGYIGFQGDHWGKWRIRNLRIKALDPAVPLRLRPTEARAERRRARTGAPALPVGDGRWTRPDGRQVPATGQPGGRKAP